MTFLGKKVLIFGGSRGLGKTLAEQLQLKGCDVRIIKRDECDFESPGCVDRFIAQLTDDVKSVNLVIFSAGLGDVGYCDIVEPAAYRRNQEVNFLAPITLHHALAQHSPAKKFVFLLSAAGDFLVPGNSPYGLSKRSLRDYLEFIRVENAFEKHSILIVRPGFVLTGFRERLRVHGDMKLAPTLKGRSPELVAKKIIRALERDCVSLSLSPIPSILGILQSILPWQMALLIQKIPSLRRKQ